MKEIHSLNAASSLLESDWFDTSFFGYFLSNDADTFKRFVRKKRFRISDENLSPRVLNHWIKEGLYHDDREHNKGWMALSITDAILITIIKKLRAFGMSLSKIKRMRESLDAYNEMDKGSNCLLLDFYLAYGQVSLEPIQLIVLETGESIIVRQKVLNEMLQMGVLTDYIALDLNSLLAKGANNRPNMTKYVPTELEEEIRNTIKKNELISLNIKINENEYHLTKEILLKDKKSAEGLMNILKYATHEQIKTGKKAKHIIKEHKKIKRDDPNKE